MGSTFTINSMAQVLWQNIWMAKRNLLRLRILFLLLRLQSEESAPILENTIYEADRPGTPALGDEGNLIVDDAPSRLYRNSLGDDDSTYEESARYHRDNYTIDRHLSDGATR
ncbi:hypothetical protein TNCT_85621 [Trichonephila clavata]|uniref:Uncharacterized protein n=1 Tax=Trichonephila clavata TaxID=2740835 RepID=A0A8X6M199_TRICU|nr:hypothetical protein TNCT_85621 [Trichonephila clavata]